MRGAPAVGDGGAGGDAGQGQPPDQRVEHRLLAAMEMVGSRRVDDDAVRRIGGHDRRHALQHPECQPFERLRHPPPGRRPARRGRAPAPAPWRPACRREGRRSGPRRRPPARPAGFLPGRPGRAAPQPEAPRRQPSAAAGRSDQVGRNSETTRVIARLQLEIRALAGPRPDQLDQPPMPPDAGHRQRRRTAAPRPASASSRPWAGRSRRPPSAAASAAARCRSSRSPRRRVAADAMPSSTGGQPRRPPPRGRRGVGLPPCRPAPPGRRRPRHRSPGREQGRPGPVAGAKRSGRAMHQSTLPFVRAAMPAAKSAAAAPSIAPLPPPATSCRAPSASPPPGRRESTSAIPKGSTDLNAAAPAFDLLDLRAQ